MEWIHQQWERWLSDMPEIYSNILESVFVILILIIIRLIVLRIVYRKTEEVDIRYRWRKNMTYILTFIGFIVVGRIWFEGVGSLATFLGLLGAGLIIAIREPLMDMAGWGYLLWRKPFVVGDRIEIGGNQGDVIDTRLFKFTLLEIGNWVHADQSTGRVIHIANHRLFIEPIANYTSGFDFIWNEIEVIITFESNWKKAKEILTRIANDHLNDYVADADKQVKKASNSYLIKYNYLTPIVYSEVVSGQGVKLTLRHLTDPRKRRKTNMIIWEDILDRFQSEVDIHFAYQTYRITGKPDKGV